MDNLIVRTPTVRENIHVGNWDFFYEQLSCGSFHAQVRSAEITESILMVEESSNQPVMSGGRLGENHISLTIHCSPESKGIFCGKPMLSHHIGLLSPDRDFELYTKTPLDIVTLTLGLEDPKLLEVGALLLDVFHKNHHNGDVIESGEISTAIRALTTNIADLIHSNPDILGKTTFRSRMEDLVIFSLIETIETSLKKCTFRKSIPASAWLVTEFRREILCNGANAFSLTKACEKLGVAHRTLHKSISDHLGVGPLTFCRYIRLNGARKALLEAARTQKPASVAEVAEEYGFWHLPRFSAYYKAMFGELPSETLKATH